MISTNAERIAQQARKSLSIYCVEECKSYCCRKGYLVLSEKEADLVSHGTIKTLETNGQLARMANGNYSLNMSIAGCPSFKDEICSIHKSRNRPMACKQFPLFFDGMTIMLSNRCLAVRNGMLYPYIKKLLALGYTLREKKHEADVLSDSDIHQVIIENPNQKPAVVK